MVGMQGFEPWTSRSRSVRATKLRYIPTLSFPDDVARVLAATKCILSCFTRFDQSHFTLKYEQKLSICAIN